MTPTETPGERWVLATLAVDQEGVRSQAVWVNMANITRIETKAGGTVLRLSGGDFGPFAEPPEHFLP